MRVSLWLFVVQAPQSSQTSWVGIFKLSVLSQTVSHCLTLTCQTFNLKRLEEVELSSYKKRTPLCVTEQVFLFISCPVNLLSTSQIYFTTPWEGPPPPPPVDTEVNLKRMIL